MRSFISLVSLIILFPIASLPAYSGVVTVDLSGPTALQVGEVGTYQITVSNFIFDTSATPYPEDRVQFVRLEIDLGDGSPEFAISTSNKLYSVYLASESDPSNIVRSMTFDITYQVAGIYDLSVTTIGQFGRGLPAPNQGSFVASDVIRDTQFLQVNVSSAAVQHTVPVPGTLSLIFGGVAMVSLARKKKRDSGKVNAVI